MVLLGHTTQKKRDKNYDDGIVMKIVFCSFLPPKGFIAINLFGVCVVRKEFKYIFDNNTRESKHTVRHEAIHTAQMKEMLYIGFYLAYFFEWLIKLFKYGKSAYYYISFEQEAYKYADDINYLSTRKHFAQYKKL